MTSSTPLSMVSTTSAWCRASRAAQLMASVGVLKATGSKWRGRLLDGDGGGVLNQRSSTLAKGVVTLMNSTAMPTLKAKWKATTCSGTEPK